MGIIKRYLKTDWNDIMMRISEASIKAYLPDWEDVMEPYLKEMLADNKMEWLRQYRSPCKRYMLMTSNFVNMCDPKTGIGWNLHIDNSDMCTIGSVNVEFIEQVNQIIEIYKNY